MSIRGSPITQLNCGRPMSLKQSRAHDYACAFDEDLVNKLHMIDVHQSAHFSPMHHTPPLRLQIAILDET